MQTIGGDTATAPPIMLDPIRAPRHRVAKAASQNIASGGGRLLDLLRWLVNELLAQEGEDMISERAKFKEDLLYAT